jgi:hypothetical protein
MAEATSSFLLGNDVAYEVRQPALSERDIGTVVEHDSRSAYAVVGKIPPRTDTDLYDQPLGGRDELATKCPEKGTLTGLGCADGAEG